MVGSRQALLRNSFLVRWAEIALSFGGVQQVLHPSSGTVGYGHASRSATFAPAVIVSFQHLCTCSNWGVSQVWLRRARRGPSAEACRTRRHQSELRRHQSELSGGQVAALRRNAQGTSPGRGRYPGPCGLGVCIPRNKLRCMSVDGLATRTAKHQSIRLLRLRASCRLRQGGRPIPGGQVFMGCCSSNTLARFIALRKPERERRRRGVSESPRNASLR